MNGVHGAGRHEGPGPVDVADRLGHGLGHVGAGVEVQLHQGGALDVLRFDVMDAGDVEEVVFVVVGEEPFHLAGVHAAVGLGHVDDRQVERGEDVHLHARARPTRWRPATAAMPTITVIGWRRAKTIGLKFMLV